MAKRPRQLTLGTEPTKCSAGKFGEFRFQQVDDDIDYNRYKDENQDILDETLPRALKFSGHDSLLSFKSAQSDKRNTKTKVFPV